MQPQLSASLGRNLFCRAGINTFNGTTHTGMDHAGSSGGVVLVTADSEVKTRLDFTARLKPIEESFEKLAESGGKTGRILDGVDAAISMLAKRPPEERRLVLLLSEARDRGSDAKSSDVLTHAEQQNVTIYTASYSAYVTPFTTKASELQPAAASGLDILALFTEIAHAAKQNVGKALAGYTGGRNLSFETLHRLEDDLTEMATKCIASINSASCRSRKRSRSIANSKSK